MCSVKETICSSQQSEFTFLFASIHVCAVSIFHFFLSFSCLFSFASFSSAHFFLLSNHFPLFIFCNDLRTFLLLFVAFHGGGDATVAVAVPAALQSSCHFFLSWSNVHGARVIVVLFLCFCYYLLRRMQRIL